MPGSYVMTDDEGITRESPVDSAYLTGSLWNSVLAKSLTDCQAWWSSYWTFEQY